MQKQKISLEWLEDKVKLGDLKHYNKNPRHISDKELERLKNSINEFGYHQRILVDVDDTIIGGHQRVTALEQLDYSSEFIIKVLKPNRKLTKDEFKRLNVVDNTDFGDFDVDMLLKEFEVDDLLDLGVDEKLLNIDDSEEDNEKKDKLEEGNELKENFIVEIECFNFIKQKETYEKLTDMGYKCKVLTL